MTPRTPRTVAYRVVDAGTGQSAGWAGNLRPVSTLPGEAGPVGQTFLVADLVAAPVYRTWPAGPIQVTGAAVKPGAAYRLQAVDQACDAALEQNFSAPLAVSTSAWGDVAGPFDQAANRWSAPDGSVDLIKDVVSIIDAFAGKPTTSKTRTDLEPAVPDQLINISDVVRGLGAFRGNPYPF